MESGRPTDLGDRVSYEVLEKGTPVYTAEGEQIGTVAHVLAAEREDIFDGIVIAEHHRPEGHRFADADQIGEIHERAVFLKLDRAAAEQLPEPSANPAVMYDDPADRGNTTMHDRLRRAWDMLTGNY